MHLASHVIVRLSFAGNDQMELKPTKTTLLNGKRSRGTRIQQANNLSFQELTASFAGQQGVFVSYDRLSCAKGPLFIIFPETSCKCIKKFLRNNLTSFYSKKIKKSVLRLFETLAAEIPHLFTLEVQCQTRKVVLHHMSNTEKKGWMWRDHILGEFSCNLFLGNLSNKLFSEEKF